MLRFELHDQPMVALPERALFHEPSGTLFVADLHLGKSSAFRAAGIPVPETTPRTLARLSACIDAARADRVVVLGDLIHAPTGRTPAVVDAVANWRTRYAQLDVVLIRGNHDVSSGDPPSAWNMAVLTGPMHDTRTPFILAHTPDELIPRSASYGLCGHIHPALSLAVLSRHGSSPRRSAPCLWMTPCHAVLPAFGDFTGGYRVHLADRDHAVLFIDGEVFEAPRRSRRV